MQGELYETNGRNTLRFERRIAHPPAKVWRAITEPQQLVQWFPAAVELELAVGGDVTFDFQDGVSPLTRGTILEFDPLRVLAFTWEGDLLRFELQPDGAGSLLIFSHTFDDRYGAASFASGWQLCLDGMEQLLEDRPVEASSDSTALHEAYVEALGLDHGVAQDMADGWQVRFERQLTRPAELVWKLLSGDSAPAPGDPPPPAITVPGIAAGRLTAIEPLAVLEYEWLDEQRPAGKVRWQLGQGTGHGPRLVVTQTGSQAAQAAREMALEAWRQRIGDLATQLRSVPAQDTA